MTTVIPKVLATVALSVALAGFAAAPANADVVLPSKSTGSAGVDAGSSLLQAGSATFVNPIPGIILGILCPPRPGQGLCGLGDL